MSKMFRTSTHQATGLTRFAQSILVALALTSAAAAETRNPLLVSTENGVESAHYFPIQAITYELGSKKLSGYFQQVEGRCAMTLMLFENVNPDVGTPDSSPARLQFSVSPGDNARIDSVEGEGIGLRCNSHAETVTAARVSPSKRVAGTSQTH
jgi:hypothetical protein